MKTELYSQNVENQNLNSVSAFYVVMFTYCVILMIYVHEITNYMLLPTSLEQSDTLRGSRDAIGEME